MFHLEYRLNQEALRFAVVSAKRQHLAEDAAARLSFNMDDKIDGFSDLGFGVGEGGLRVAAHDQIGETSKGFLCRVGMGRCPRSCVAGVKGIKKRSPLDSTHSAENDPAGSEAKGLIQ